MMEAIEDSLDEQVDEAHYARPEIQQIFKLIEKDNVTPQERANMFEEYSQEEVKQETFQEGFDTGLKEGEQKAREESARHLLSLGALTEEQIAQTTGLSLEKVKTLA